MSAAHDPYYQDDHCIIYHGDCRDIMPDLSFDVIVTDPPYGIALQTDYSSLNGSTKEYQAVHGDDEPFDPSFMFAYPCAMFGPNHYARHMPTHGTWHVWDKRESAASNMFSDLEMWWTSWNSGPSRIYRYQWIAGTHPGVSETVAHPTSKPLAVMRNIVQDKRTPLGIILDPFMGSGTTLRAAKDLGRKAIGIELEEKYCEIAARRLGQEVLDLWGTT